MITYRKLKESEICRELFDGFIRRQIVGKCWRRENDKWVIKNDPFIDDWSEKDYKFLVKCLKNTAETGGFVYGAFLDGKLKGFVSVEPDLWENEYLDLSSIHVSEEMRGKGMGKKLFFEAVKWAAKKGADKLYISAHSAAETQAFYRDLGCVDAQLLNQKHAEAEPYDCQIEYVIKPCIRKAQERDADVILLYDKHIAREELTNLINLNRVYIAEENGQFCGWLRYNLFWDNTPFMNMLYFLEGFRNRGYGRQLAGEWENDMKSLGYSEVMTSTQSDETAQHFYTKLGYKVIGGFSQNNDPFELIMSKSLLKSE